MSGLVPDMDDRTDTVTLLLLAEVLTRRGEVGPLSRVIFPTPRSVGRTANRPRPRDKGAEEEPK